MMTKLEIVGIVLGSFVALLLILAALFGIVYGISAIIDANWDCPPGAVVVYDSFGFKSSCVTYPLQSPIVIGGRT